MAKERKKVPLHPSLKVDKKEGLDRNDMLVFEGEVRTAIELGVPDKVIVQARELVRSDYQVAMGVLDQGIRALPHVAKVLETAEQDAVDTIEYLDHNPHKNDPRRNDFEEPDADVARTGTNG